MENKCRSGTNFGLSDIDIEIIKTLKAIHVVTEKITENLKNKKGGC